jgi:hypothetical protein
VALLVIVQSHRAGLSSPLPAASVARTWNACGPVESEKWSTGGVQGVQLPASSRHSKVEPASLETKSNVAFSLPEARDDTSGVAPLHVVNALFIWIVGYHLAMRALVARVRGDLSPPPTADAPQQP